MAFERKVLQAMIAVNEGIDTGSGFDDDFFSFRDVFNKYYAKIISRKIKSTFQAKGADKSRGHRKKHILPCGSTEHADGICGSVKWKTRGNVKFL